MCRSKSRIIASVFAVLLCAPISAQVTQRVSVESGGAQGDSDTYDSSISADGRFVAFLSVASNLVAGDTNVNADVFVRDRQTGTTERVSVATGGTQGNSYCESPALSSDGRFVAFMSFASNLVVNDTNGSFDVFVHDRQSGTTERVSVDSNGVEGDRESSEASISPDGRFVAFTSNASNLVVGDTNGFGDIFVRDRQSGTTDRVSVSTGGAQGNFGSFIPSISADGRFVAFASVASILVVGDTNGLLDVFLRDRQSGTTERVSVATGGAQANSSSESPSISADGRFVGFISNSSNLVVGDTNGLLDDFVRDVQSGTTERVSVDSAGVEGNSDSLMPLISADGRFVAFISNASNFVAGDTNGFVDVFVHDRQSGTTERVSVDSAGVEGNSNSVLPSISVDGRFVAFNSDASNFVAGDTNGFVDVFVHDRLGSPSFTSLCVPGAGGVIACPCSNPSGGFGQGCDNSAATGGALLSASGGTYLSSDSLVFTASGEMPSEMSVVVQGSALVASGLVYGQGVRCVGGSLERLYVKTASGGSITAPDFGAGDPSVSARSAARGSPIQAGQSRWYFVYYRDAIVLGGCPASNTFNATQAGQVSWSP